MNLLHRVEASIRSLYIFNTEYGQSEGQETDKIFYYHPKDIELNTKIKDIGLSEAIISFLRIFSDKNDECSGVHTMKTNQLFYEIEYNFWMVMTLNAPKELHSKDNIDYEDYHNDELCDKYYRCLMEQSYNEFRLINGSFKMILENSDVNSVGSSIDNVACLKNKLEQFYDKFIGNLTLGSYNMTQHMRSLQYLPLQKSLFLKVHNFVNVIKAIFPVIVDVLLLYNDSLVCGGKFQPIDLYTIFNYVLDKSIQKRSTSNDNCCNNLDENLLQEVFLIYNYTLTPFKLYIYYSNNVLLGLFFKDPNNNVREKFKDIYNDLKSYIEDQISTLSNEIEDCVPALQQQCNIQDPEAMSPKYLFINEQTLKHLCNIPTARSTSIPMPISRSNTSTNLEYHLIPTNVLHTLIDLANPAFKSSCRKDERQNDCAPIIEETIVKSTSDFWIVKRQCNWRHFYVIIFSKKATLLDVTAEAERIFVQHFKDDVFFDK